MGREKAQNLQRSNSYQETITFLNPPNLKEIYFAGAKPRNEEVAFPSTTLVLKVQGKECLSL